MSLRATANSPLRSPYCMATTADARGLLHALLQMTTASAQLRSLPPWTANVPRQGTSLVGVPAPMTASAQLWSFPPRTPPTVNVPRQGLSPVGVSALAVFTGICDYPGACVSLQSTTTLQRMNLQL